MSDEPTAENDIESIKADLNDCVVRLLHLHSLNINKKVLLQTLLQVVQLALLAWLHIKQA